MHTTIRTRRGRQLAGVLATTATTTAVARADRGDSGQRDAQQDEVVRAGQVVAAVDTFGGVDRDQRCGRPTEVQ